MKLRKQILTALMTDFPVVEGWDQLRASQNHIGKRSQPSDGRHCAIQCGHLVDCAVGLTRKAKMEETLVRGGGFYF